MNVRVFALLIFPVLLSSEVTAQVGAFGSLEPNEITPGLYLRLPLGRVSYQWNMSIPVMLHDPYNSNRSNVSFLSAYMLGFGAITYFGGEILMANGDVIGGLGSIALLLIPVASNGELHLGLLTVEEVNRAGLQASLFAGWETAYFQMRESKWFRFTPKVGIACFKLFGRTYGEHQSLSIGLRMGLKRNYDSPVNKWGAVVGFVALEAGVY